MKLTQRNTRQDVERQLDDVWKNLEFIVSEIDSLNNRVKQLESGGEEGVVLMVPKE